MIQQNKGKRENRTILIPRRKKRRNDNRTKTTFVRPRGEAEAREEVPASNDPCRAPSPQLAGTRLGPKSAICMCGGTRPAPAPRRPRGKCRAARGPVPDSPNAGSAGAAGHQDEEPGGRAERVRRAGDHFHQSRLWESGEGVEENLCVCVCMVCSAYVVYVCVTCVCFMRVACVCVWRVACVWRVWRVWCVCGMCVCMHTCALRGRQKERGEDRASPQDTAQPAGTGERDPGSGALPSP